MQSDVNNTVLIERFRERFPIDMWKRSGFFKENYLNEINEHWLGFEPPSVISHYSLALLYTVVMIIGVSGNALVIFMYFRCKSLRTPATTLIINLACSDLLMMSIMPIFIFNSFHFGPALGSIACQFYGFMGGLSGTVSIITLAAISFDRYYVIKYPLKLTNINIRSKIFIILSWTYGLIFSSIPLLNIGLGSYTPEGYLTSCSFDYLTNKMAARIFIMAFFVAAWVVPLSIITFCYVNILNIVLVSRKLSQDDSSRHFKEQERRRQDLKLTLTVLAVICLWFLAWTPYATIALMGYAGYSQYICPVCSMVPALFCKTASCLDPYIYALTHARFKTEIRTFIFGAKLVRRRNRTTVCISRIDTHRQEDENTSAVTTIEDEIVNETPGVLPVDSGCDMFLFKDILSDKGSKAPLWIFRPTFSNKRQSFSGLVRKYSVKKKYMKKEVIRN